MLKRFTTVVEPTLHKRKRKRATLRTYKRIVALAKFYAPCSLHPKGGHDVVAYGYTLRRWQRNTRWWPWRWYSLLSIAAFQNRAHTTRDRQQVNAPNPRRLSAAKFCFVKFLDFKWCPCNAKADRPLHQALRLLGAPTCRHYMIDSVRPLFSHSHAQRAARAPVSRPIEAQGFVERLIKRVLPLPDCRVRLIISRDVEILCDVKNERRRVITSAGLDGTGAFTPWFQQAMTDRGIVFSYAALRAYVLRFICHAR